MWVLIQFPRYQSLSARTINLIGDYAGNELFMIEGDSLILTCLDTPEIDLQGTALQVWVVTRH